MSSTANQVWEAISSHSAEQTGKAIVAVDAGHRVAASGVHCKLGVIVTASHLVRRAEKVGVILPDGSRVKRTVAGSDSTTDLAAIRIESSASLATLPSHPARMSVNWFLPSHVLAVVNSPPAAWSWPTSCSVLRGAKALSFWRQFLFHCEEWLSDLHLGGLAGYVDPGFLHGRLHHQGGIVFFLVFLAAYLILLRLVGWIERNPAYPTVSNVANFPIAAIDQFS